MHTSIHICIQTYIHTYIHTYICTHIHTYIPAQIQNKNNRKLERKSVIFISFPNCIDDSAVALPTLILLFPPFFYIFLQILSVSSFPCSLYRLFPFSLTSHRLVYIIPYFLMHSHSAVGQWEKSTDTGLTNEFGETGTYNTSIYR